MAKRKAEVAITCNIRQPQQAQKILITALENLRKEYDRLVAAGKQNDAETLKMKRDMDALSSAVNTNAQSMNRIKTVMDNLSGATLKQLNSALREVKRQLSGKSTSSADLEELRGKYQAITEQIKILKGETVNITKGIQTLSAQSDSWLTKAIAKQKELVSQTRQGTQAYNNQKAVLTRLMNEQHRRNMSTIQTKGQAAMRVAMSSGASLSELRTARQDLVNFKDNIGGKGISLGSTSADLDQIRTINEMLKAIDKQIDSINGKVQTLPKSAQQLVQEVRQIDFNRATPNQLKAKLDEVNTSLANMGKNDPMRQQLVHSAKQLQNALANLSNDAVNVKNVLKKLDSASPQKLKAALDQVNRSLAQMGQNDSRRKVLLQQAEKLRTAISRIEKPTINVNRVLRNLKSASLEDLRKAAHQLEQEIARLNRTGDAQKIAEKRKQLRQLNSEIDRSNKALVKQESGWKKTFQAITAYMGVTMLIGKVTSMMSKLLKLNLQFSDQLADIRKVSGLAMRDVESLATRLASIDTRTSIEELNKIAYAGAKLGIGKYGVEGLEGFTRAANQVNVALKEDLGADALTALSKITEVMGLIPKMGVEQSMLATGSAMFQLSATSTATAGNIVEFSKRLTGLAKVTGVTTDQLLGLASASDAMFLMPEVSATAFNKLFTSLQTKHNLIEKELSITPGTINNLYSAGKAMDAMILIFEKMKEKGNMNALQGVFKDLGSDGARLVNVMVTMSQNVDMLKSHLAISKQAFEEGTAVTNEYNIQQETAQALMERASNVWEKAFVNPQGVDNVKDLAQAWYDLSVQLTSNQFWMGGMELVLGGLILAVETLLQLLPALLAGLLFKGVVGGIVSITASITAMNGGLTMSTLSTKGLAAAWGTLNAVQKVNVFAAIITAVMTLVTLFASLSRNIKDTNTWMQGFDSSLHHVRASIAIVQDELKRYVQAINSAKQGTNQHAAAIKNFNDKFGKYYNCLLHEKATATDIALAYERVNRALERKMILELREEDLNKFYKPAVGWTAARLSEYGDIAKTSNTLSQYNSTWLKGYFDDAKDLQSAISGLAQLWGIDQKFVSQAMAHRSDASIPEYLDGDGAASIGPGGGFANYGPAITHFTPEIRMLYAAARYGSQFFSTQNRYNKVIEKYKPFEDLLVEDPIIEPDTPLGNLSNLAEDKDELKAANDAKRERKRQLLQDLKEAEDEASAIIDNIKNFYQRQINQILQVANEQGWDEALIKSATDVVLSRMNLALSQARKGIAGTRNEWDAFTATMEADIMEMDEVIGVDEQGNQITYNESRVLLGLILNNDLGALHDKIVKIEKDLGKPSNAALDAIWKNASINEGVNETATQRHLQERKKLLLEDAYTQKVNSDYSSSMTRLGFFDVDEDQAKILVQGGLPAQDLLRKRQEEIDEVFSHTRDNIVELINIGDVTTDDGRNRFMELVFGADWESKKSELTGVLSLTGEDLRLFYDELIKYNNDYIEAQKRAEERVKKLIDFQWDRSEPKKDLDRRERNSDLYRKGLLQHRNLDEAENLPEYGLYGNTRFASDFGVDPEIEAYRLKIEAAKAYYDFLESHGATAQQLRDQEKAVITAQSEYVQQLANRIKKQMDEVLQMHDPIVNFGTKAGEAFALMTEDAKAGSKALKAAVGDMINDFMKQTVEMTKEYIKRRIMQKVHDRLTSIEASTHEAELTQIQTAGDTTRQVLHETAQTGLSSIDQEQAAVRETTAQTETASEVSTEAAGTGAKVSLGIASGAAKTIGALGWWGIPLVAVISMLLNGLLSFAMSKVSSLFGGKSVSDTGPQAKLVSGMLTYDSGNVQAFRGVEDGKTFPVVGSDGKVYAAKDGGELSTGLVRDPITTLVNGQPALVAERGPEMVIGRETTAAMMMARPDILAEIVKFDRQRSGRTYRAYDSGNIDSLQFSVPDGSAAGSEDMAQLRETINALTLVLSALQRDGIPAHINKYGRGGVTESARSGGKFMQRNSGDPLWRG